MLSYHSKITDDMERRFIYISYDGSRYHGWQIQPGDITVQEEVEKAMSMLLRDCIKVTAAGRTDTGVNADMMPAHFDCQTDVFRNFALHANSFEEQLMYRMNKILPRDIAIRAIRRVCPEAHARFSATSRTYHYYISLAKDPFNYRYRLCMPQSPDFGIMNEAAGQLLGVHDFECFSKSHPDVKTSVCSVSRALWEQTGEDEWRFVITANRFLRNMVRAIVGTLLDIGLGRQRIEDLIDIMQSRDRRMAGESVKGEALFLHDVEYPEKIFL